MIGQDFVLLAAGVNHSVLVKKCSIVRPYELATAEEFRDLLGRLIDGI